MHPLSSKPAATVNSSTQIKPGREWENKRQRQISTECPRFEPVPATNNWSELVLAHCMHEISSNWVNRRKTGDFHPLENNGYQEATGTVVAAFVTFILRSAGLKCWWVLSAAFKYSGHSSSCQLFKSIFAMKTLWEIFTPWTRIFIQSWQLFWVQNRKRNTSVLIFIYSDVFSYLFLPKRV